MSQQPLHHRCPKCRRPARVNLKTRMAWHRDAGKQRKWCETSSTTGWPPSKLQDVGHL